MSPWIGRTGVTLEAFVAARLDEDEATAPEEDPGEFAPVHPYIRAARTILAAYEANDGDVKAHLGPYPRKHGEWDGLRLAVRHLATVWSDHLDYDEAWSAANRENRQEG